MRNARRRMAGEAAHVQFINHTIDQWNIQRLVVRPVELVLDQQVVAIRPVAGLVLAPRAPIRERMPIRIEQNLLWVEAIDSRIRIRLHVESVPVLRVEIDTFDEDVPYIASAVRMGVERKLDIGILCSRVKQHQRAGCSVAREDGKVDPLAADGGAHGKRNSAADAVSRRRARGRLTGRSRGKGCGRHSGRWLLCAERMHWYSAKIAEGHFAKVVICGLELGVVIAWRPLGRGGDLLRVSWKQISRELKFARDDNPTHGCVYASRSRAILA